MYNKIVLLSFCLFLLFHNKLKSQEQEFNPIFTAMPSLQIAPDARGGGMGDIGVATMPDVYSQHWNAAKYPFITSEGGLAFSYTPWLSNIVSDINMLYVSGFWKFGDSKLNAISTSLRYFSLGDIEVSHPDGEFWESVSPHEFALDLAYSRKLSETFSGAVTLRYIRGDYSTGSDEMTAGNAFAADIAGYNESYFYIGRSEALLGLGFNLSNIGTKISYDGGENSHFLPANMRVGASLGYPLNLKNTITLSLDLNKLMVPTPELMEESEDVNDKKERYNNISSIGGIFESFVDAPGGFKEEMQEVMWSLGLEYVYNNQFSLRSGYYHENEYKGNRRYMSFGAGFRARSFQIDAAYLVSTSQSNPLDQTLRLSLGFDLEGLKNLIN